MPVALKLNLSILDSKLNHLYEAIIKIKISRTAFLSFFKKLQDLIEFQILTTLIIYSYNFALLIYNSFSLEKNVSLFFDGPERTIFVYLNLNPFSNFFS